MAFKTSGGVAQLGEHLLCKQGVRSSILLISTTRSKKREARSKKMRRALNEASTGDERESCI